MINCFIPIKSYSERIKDKNFLIFNGKKLYTHIINASIESNSFDHIYIDTDSKEIEEFALSKNCKLITRKPELSLDTANGNDLLNHHQSLVDCDYYFQLFATAPNLKPDSIKNCVESLVKNQKKYDSILTVKKHFGWFWYNNIPVTYRPSVLPRSQDSKPILEETTGLYGITKEALLKCRCRIGHKPFFYELTGEECVDIDWQKDLK
jgi:N-acylneuraminate cytidylyltransferase